MELREYQTEAINDLRDNAARNKYKKLILVAPCGAGKSIIAAKIMEYCIANGNRALAICHRRVLVRQLRDKIKECGMEAGIVMSGEVMDSDRDIQVASIQTLISRRKKHGDSWLPPADLLIVDEAHVSTAETFRNIIEHYIGRDALVLGLTATPVRRTGNGLGDLYQYMTQAANIKQLTEWGFLVPARYFVPSTPDLKGIKMVAGDYSEKELEVRMNKVKLVGDVVENWVRHGEDRQTIVFASGIKHSMSIKESFCESGISAEHIDGNTPQEERDRILGGLSSGKIRVVSSCAVLSEGFDCPPVSCIIFARPTKSIGLYIQSCGRGLRIHPGKEDCIIFDHSGSVIELGKLDEFTEWTLDKTRNINKENEKKQDKKGKEIVCKQCTAIYSGRRNCPECGHEPKTFGQGVEYKDGRLYEIGKEQTAEKYTKEIKQKWYSQLLGYARERGYTKGWAAHNYRAKFGVWPRLLKESPVSPESEVRAFISKKNKAYFAKQKALR